jgi:hypothetical protein
MAQSHWGRSEEEVLRPRRSQSQKEEGRKEVVRQRRGRHGRTQGCGEWSLPQTEKAIGLT